MPEISQPLIAEPAGWWIPKPNRPRMCCNLIIMIAACLPGFSNPVVAHEFEDGHIEQTIEVIVESDRVLVQYGIGLNDNTARELIARWTEAAERRAELENPQAAPSSTEQEPGSGDAGPGGAIEHEPGHPARQPLAPMAPDPAPVSPSTGAPSVMDAAPLAETPAGASDPSTVEEAENSDGEPASGESSDPDMVDSNPTHAAGTEPTAAEIETRLRERIVELGGAEVLRGLSATCNGIESQVELVSAELAVKHHVDVLFSFEFPLYPESDLAADEPDGDAIQLVFQSTGFHRFAGAVRTALKARGPVFIRQTDTAPNLMRADRIAKTANVEPVAELATAVRAIISSIEQ